jgi:hypothetical protein
LAKSYEILGRPENAKFWFDVDMDGSFENDQAVLVRMGLANEYSLRPVGQKKVESVEEMERWSIALGMALQEEEGEAESLRAQVERLKGIVAEKNQEIEELESGL